MVRCDRTRVVGIAAGRQAAKRLEPAPPRLHIEDLRRDPYYQNETYVCDIFLIQREAAVPGSGPEIVNATRNWRDHHASCTYFIAFYVIA